MKIFTCVLLLISIFTRINGNKPDLSNKHPAGQKVKDSKIFSRNESHFSFPAIRNKAAEKTKDDTLSIAPFNSLADFAENHGIALSGIRLAPINSAPRPGDTVTLLITLFERGLNYGGIPASSSSVCRHCKNKCRESF